MVQLTLQPHKGNNNRFFPHVGYLGLTPVIVQGKVKTQIADNADRPLPAYSLSVRLRCYEDRSRKSNYQQQTSSSSSPSPSSSFSDQASTSASATAIGQATTTATTTSSRTNHVLWETYQEVWNKDSEGVQPVDGGEWGLLGDLERNWRLVVPIDAVENGAVSTLSFKHYRIWWQVEAVLSHKPLALAGRELLKAHPIPLYSYSTPRPENLPSPAIWITPTAPPLQRPIEYFVSADGFEGSSLFSPGDELKVNLRLRRIFEGVAVKKVVVSLERSFHYRTLSSFSSTSSASSSSDVVEVMNDGVGNGIGGSAQEEDSTMTDEILTDESIYPSPGTDIVDDPLSYTSSSSSSKRISRTSTRSSAAGGFGSIFNRSASPRQPPLSRSSSQGSTSNSTTVTTPSPGISSSPEDPSYLGVSSRSAYAASKTTSILNVEEDGVTFSPEGVWQGTLLGTVPKQASIYHYSVGESIRTPFVSIKFHICVKLHLKIKGSKNECVELGPREIFLSSISTPERLQAQTKFDALLSRSPLPSTLYPPQASRSMSSTGGKAGGRTGSKRPGTAPSSTPPPFNSSSSSSSSSRLYPIVHANTQPARNSVPVMPSSYGDSLAPPSQPQPGPPSSSFAPPLPTFSAAPSSSHGTRRRSSDHGEPIDAPDRARARISSGSGLSSSPLSGNSPPRSDGTISFSVPPSTGSFGKARSSAFTRPRTAGAGGTVPPPLGGMTKRFGSKRPTSSGGIGTGSSGSGIGGIHQTFDRSISSPPFQHGSDPLMVDEGRRIEEEDGLRVYSAPPNQTSFYREVSPPNPMVMSLGVPSLSLEEDPGSRGRSFERNTVMDPYHRPPPLSSSSSPRAIFPDENSVLSGISTSGLSNHPPSATSSSSASTITPWREQQRSQRYDHDPDQQPQQSPPSPQGTSTLPLLPYSAYSPPAPPPVVRASEKIATLPSSMSTDPRYPHPLYTSDYKDDISLADHRQQPRQLPLPPPPPPPSSPHASLLSPPPPTSSPSPGALSKRKSKVGNLFAKQPSPTPSSSEKEKEGRWAFLRGGGKKVF